MDGPSGWLALDLAAPDVDRTEVGEPLDSSYRRVALVRMLRALDDVAPDAPRSPAPGTS